MSGVDMTDILGIGSAAPKPTAQAPVRKAAAPAEAKRPLVDQVAHPSMFRKPVGITFLAAVCGKQPKQIQKRLEKCPVVEWSRHGGSSQPMYDFLTAMAYLIPPKGNIEDWFAQQNAGSLPPYVNKMWWDSAHQRNRVMLSSNDLWHTEDVMVLAGRTSMTIRDEMKMWIEDLPDKDKMTDAQYTAMMKNVDTLLAKLQDILVKMPRETLSMSAHIQSELDSNSTVPDDADRADDEADE